jgi:hypothetical protein
MLTEKVFRIYTEEKNKKAIIELALKRFESFTIQPTVGYYRGKREASVVLEFVGAKRKEIEEFAGTIRVMNGQKSVLILTTNANTTISRR